MRVQFATPNVEELRKENMLVDMHFHSRYSHDCSTPLRSIVNRARELGVCVALTDHNTIQGVMKAQSYASDVIKPGVEVTTKEGKDILCYFYKYEDLERFFTTHVQPYVKKKSSLRSVKSSLRMGELLEAIQHYDAVAAIAHPFAVGARRSYPFFKNSKRSKMLKNIDAVEVVNQSLPHKLNLSALGWSMQLDKSIIGGSDGHILDLLGSAFTVSSASSWDEFLDSVKRRDVLVIGEEKKLRHHVLNVTRIIKEKAKVIQNGRIRKQV